MIVKFVKALSETPVKEEGQCIGPEYSMRLGLMCHFICDYFCFAHNADFTGSLTQHITYERDLDEYLRENCKELLDLDGSREVEAAPLGAPHPSVHLKQQACVSARGLHDAKRHHPRV